MFVVERVLLKRGPLKGGSASTDRAKAVPFYSPYTLEQCMSYVYFNEMMHEWRHVCVCMCMSVLCLRGGFMFCYVSCLSFFLPIQVLYYRMLNTELHYFVLYFLCLAFQGLDFSKRNILESRRWWLILIAHSPER